MGVPSIRVRAKNQRPVRQDGGHVLYWMTASRRPRWNFGLDRALEHCRVLQKPLIVLEALRCGHRWSSDRFHAFVAQGMADNQAAFAAAGIAYFPYLEPQSGAGRGLLQEFATNACVVVTDDYPCFFLPRMVDAAARALPVLLEDVDSNGLLPLRAAGQQVFLRAQDFRRFLQKELPKHLFDRPDSAPFTHPENSVARGAILPPGLAPRFAPAPDLSGSVASLSALPLDHAVAPVARRGGAVAAEARLEAFLERGLDRYVEDRSEPGKEGQSSLSPYLHWGHISAHAVVDAVFTASGWAPDRVAEKPNGSREGFWGLPPAAEAFFDELVTWREVGFNFASRRSDHDQFSSLPAWAQTTLLEHASDRRSHLYSLAELEHSKTHDPLWNAAQRQLVEEGVIHNYLRMLWGKKVLEWTASPQQAAQFLVELNNKYALDGRDPNSYSGIFWVLGRYDRPWGPIREVFGMIRYMTSENTAKKFDVDGYIRKYGFVPDKPRRKNATQRRLS